MKFIAAILSWVIGWVFRKMDQLDAAIQLPAPRIKLQPVSPEGSAGTQELRACVRELAGLGFEEAGTYNVLGLANVQIAGLIHPLTQVSACAWMHNAQLYLDLVTTFRDSTSLTTANHAAGSTLPGRPGHELRQSPGCPPAELYRSHLAARADQPVLKVSVERFAETYEERWSSQQDWLAARGGYSLEELRVLLQGQDKDVSEESLVFIRERIADSALRNWYAIQLAPPFPYEEIRECLVIIHDELSQERTGYLFDRWSSGLEMPEGVLTPRQVFAILRGRKDARLERIWTKHTGQQADYYCPKELVEMLREEMGLTG